MLTLLMRHVISFTLLFRISSSTLVTELYTPFIVGYCDFCVMQVKVFMAHGTESLHSKLKLQQG